MTTDSLRLASATESQAEDDSPFLSMADFFSLISLTTIYIIIAFSPQSPLARESIDIESAVASATGPASEIDNDIAYVSILSSPQLILRVAPSGAGSIQESLVRSGSSGISESTEWLQNILSVDPIAKRVVFYMGAEDERGDAHRLLHELLRNTKRKFPVSLVFLDDEQITR